MTASVRAPSSFGRVVLFVTPFASHPSNSGQRRRVHQMASLLKQAGCRVVFVLYAMEIPWYWYFDETAYREMADAWDEVHVFPASKHVGLPPQSGHVHSLDEWWDPSFEQFLNRLASIHKFDVIMVTNVWLSKAFYVAGPTAFTILDTLDIFSERIKIARRTQINPEFFWLEPVDEVFGWNRSDLVVTVTDEEADCFGDTCVKPVTSIPIVLASRPRPPRRQSYLYKDRIVFGVLSSAQIYTVIGLNEVLAELERNIGRTFAPVDIVVAGTICQHVKTSLPVRKLGEISSEEEFFDQVDFVLAPQFEGTGFKVKVADAMTAGMPILAAEHSGVGTFLPESLLFSSPETLVAAMSRIALERPALSRFNALVAQAAQALIAKRDRSEQQLIARINAARGALVFDLRGLTVADHFPIILSYINWTRIMSATASLFVLVDDALRYAVDGVRNRWFRVVTETELPAFKAARPEAISIGPFPARDLPRHEQDSRWSWLVGGMQTEGFLDCFPYLNPDLIWMPGLVALVRSMNTRPLPEESVRRIAVTENAGFADSLGRAWGASGLVMAATDRSAICALVAALLTLPDGAAVEIQWLCATQTSLERLIREIALSKRLTFTGLLPDAEPSREDPELYANALLAGLLGINGHARFGVTVR